MTDNAQPLDPLALLSTFEHKAGVVLAVSGGSDSTALMLLAAHWRDAGGTTPLAVATIDHRLRPGSDEDCRAVAALAGRLSLPCRILSWAEAADGPRLMERAREVRRTLLAAVCLDLGADAVATAHTLDDQAETVLMRLAHGSGPAGLAAIRPVTAAGGVTWLRPLLGVRRAALRAMLTAEGISWSEDPSNIDPRFERARLRRAMPGLAAIGLTPARLSRLAERAARAETALRVEADAACHAMAARDGDGLRFDATSFAALPEEIRLRLLDHAIREAGGGTPRLERLEALLAALRGTAPLRRTLAGALISLGPRWVRVRAAPQRRIPAKAGTLEQS